MALTTTAESVADFDIKSINSSGSVDGGPNLASIAAALPYRKDTKEELPSTGMMCDVKNLWEGKNKCLCCTNWLEEMPEDIQPNPEETEAVQRFALVVRHKKSHGFSSKAMMVSSIVIQSPLLKPLLEEVFDGYAGITATLRKVAFSRPFAPFFYRWSHFKKVVENQEDPTTRAHAQLLYDVLSKELDETLNTYHDLLSHGVITFNYLWTLFKPGDLLLCQMHGHEMIMKLQSCDYSGGGFSLAAKYIDYNGHNFGYASHDFMINSFEGTKSITDLDAYPIQFNGEAGVIESRLATRGKRFEVLQGYHFKLHKGKAELIPSMFGDRGIASRHRQLNGRVIIYAEMYDRYNSAECMPLVPIDSISFAPKLSAEAEEQHHDPFKPAPPPAPPAVDMYGRPFMPPPPMPIAPRPSNIPETHEPQTLADELYPLCSPIVKGYSLRTKNWAKFHVDNIHDIVWDDRAFDSLVLPPGYKDLILSFTRNQNATEESKFDDVIEGKGQGIVMLLTGEPGVGKTLTAESVAEYMRVPLYSMSAAQLGTDSYTVEQTLGDILEMATKWKAVLLLDETEVFLEQRTIDGLERNKLVSIFLRMLEYYRGVLFLTTNRVATLDKALESRIHLKISYPELDQNARLRVWENLIELLPPSIVGLDASDLENLSQRKLNGREIKNVIKAAQLLAKDKETALNLEHVNTVLRITQIGGGTFGVRA